MTLSFSVDARAILNLGRESIRDHTTAVIELVKNSYDADATRVDIDLAITVSNGASCHIRIRDDGTGMSPKDIQDRWLRIGYSAKRTKKISAIFGRRTTGEKGIGRISADRLGEELTLVTAPAGSAVSGLHIRWSDFEANKPIESVPINALATPSFKYENTPNRIQAFGIPPWPYPGQGTELTATGLRHSWQRDDVLRLRRELEAFVSPFSKINNFDVYVTTDLDNDLCGRIETTLPDNAAVDLEAKFDGKSQVSYTLRSNLGKRKTTKGIVDVSQLIQQTGDRARQRKPIDLHGLGPVEMHLLFYPRKAETSSLAKLSLDGLREFLDENVGVRIYRDSVRVKPYGDHSDSGGDWLLLGARKAREPAGASRKTFRVSPNQLVGAVFLSRDSNPAVVDSAGREGLIQNEAFQQLRQLTLGCITLVESAYHESFLEQSPEPQAENPKAKVDELRHRLADLKEKLTEAQRSLPKTAGKVAEASAERISETLEVLDSTSKSIEQLASQATIYRGLATTGIAATVFGHETQSSISQVEGSVYAAHNLLTTKPPRLEDALEELEKAKSFSSRVASWGSFALARVQRDKRRRRQVDLRSVAEELVNELAPVFESSGIELSRSFRPVQGRAFAMDVESVLLNLLTNAYAACQQVNRRRAVIVELGPESQNQRSGVLITVRDSGPGIAAQFRDRVWEPLFTTKHGADGKPVGTGLGLSIVDSIILESGGTKRLSRDDELKGARFDIWLPLS